MITQSTLWKKALKCNITFVNDPAFTSEYLRLQLLFVSLLCKSAPCPHSTPSLQGHPSLKNLCLHHDSETVGTKGPLKKRLSVHTFGNQSNSESLRCSSLPGRWELASNTHKFALMWEGLGGGAQQPPPSGPAQETARVGFYWLIKVSDRCSIIASVTKVGQVLLPAASCQRHYSCRAQLPFPLTAIFFVSVVFCLQP